MGTLKHIFNFPLQCNWLTKLKEAQENWKRTLQTTVFKGTSLTSGVGHNNQSPPPESSLAN
jgi:hypothetical protein